MSRFWLVRHAEAVPWTPDEMRPLSTRGRADAERLADLVAALEPIAVYTSPATRVRDTVAPAARRLGLVLQEEPDLRERHLTSSRLDDFEGGIRATWEDFGFHFPDGETNAAAQERGVRLLGRVREHHPGGGFVLSTHGNLLTLLLNHLDPAIGFDFWRSLSMPDLHQVIVGQNAAVEVTRLWT